MPRDEVYTGSSKIYRSCIVMIHFSPPDPGSTRKRLHVLYLLPRTRRNPMVRIVGRVKGHRAFASGFNQNLEAASCIVLELPFTERLKLLMQDYPHFIANPAILNAQISCLTAQHGREKIEHWHRLALNNELDRLVQELLRHHYDPSYQRSIRRNFSAAQQAMHVPIKSIDAHDFQGAAKIILDHA